MPTRVFKTAEFAGFSAKARIADALLVEAIERVERGLVDADLGGGVLKLRVARPNEGRRGGYRTIVACIIDERAFFLFGYAKNEVDNITSRALTKFREYARTLQALDGFSPGSVSRTRRDHGGRTMKMKTDEETEKRMLETIHRSIAGLHRIGVVDDATMRRFDVGCSTEEFSPTDLKALREREGASQADLARHLGVAPATVGQWERGQRRPSGAAAKLLSLVKANGLRYIVQ